MASYKSHSFSGWFFYSVTIFYIKTDLLFDKFDDLLIWKLEKYKK